MYTIIACLVVGLIAGLVYRHAMTEDSWFAPCSSAFTAIFVGVVLASAIGSFAPMHDVESSLKLYPVRTSGPASNSIFALEFNEVGGCMVFLAGEDGNLDPHGLRFTKDNLEILEQEISAADAELTTIVSRSSLGGWALHSSNTRYRIRVPHGTVGR